MHIKAYIQHIHFELLVWPLALLALYFMGTGESLCLLKRAGISWCPGCGLGHSVHHLLHGEWKAALQSHWLGPFAVAMLGYRTWQLGRLQLRTFNELRNNNI